MLKRPLIYHQWAWGILMVGNAHPTCRPRFSIRPEHSKSTCNRSAGQSCVVNAGSATVLPIGPATAHPAGIFPVVAGTVYAAMSDDSGGWFIGGSFDFVGKLPRNNAAHVLVGGFC